MGGSTCCDLASDLGKEHWHVKGAHHLFGESPTRASEEWRSPNRVLDVTIHRVCYPISETVLHQVFGRFGVVEHVQVFGGFDRVFAQVVFKSKSDAIEAFGELHGRNIYDGCCQLDIQWGASQDHCNTNLAFSCGDTMLTTATFGPAASVIGHEVFSNTDISVEVNASGKYTEATTLAAVTPSVNGPDVMEHNVEDEFPVTIGKEAVTATNHAATASSSDCSVPRAINIGVPTYCSPECPDRGVVVLTANPDTTAAAAPVFWLMEAMAEDFTSQALYGKVSASGAHTPPTTITAACGDICVVVQPVTVVDVMDCDVADKLSAPVMSTIAKIVVPFPNLALTAVVASDDMCIDISLGALQMFVDMLPDSIGFLSNCVGLAMLHDICTMLHVHGTTFGCINPQEEESLATLWPWAMKSVGEQPWPSPLQLMMLGGDFVNWCFSRPWDPGKTVNTSPSFVLMLVWNVSPLNSETSCIIKGPCQMLDIWALLEKNGLFKAQLDWCTGPSSYMQQNHGDWCPLLIILPRNSMATILLLHERKLSHFDIKPWLGCNMTSVLMLGKYLAMTCLLRTGRNWNTTCRIEFQLWPPPPFISGWTDGISEYYYASLLIVYWKLMVEPARSFEITAYWPLSVSPVTGESVLYDQHQVSAVAIGWHDLILYSFRNDTGWHLFCNCDSVIPVFMNLVSSEITQSWTSWLQGSILTVICHEIFFQQAWNNKGATHVDQEVNILSIGDDSLMQCCLGHVLYVACHFSSEKGGGEGNDLYVDMIILFKLQVLPQIADGCHLYSLDLLGSRR